MEQSCLSDMCHWLLLLLDLDGTVGVGGSAWVAIDVSMANDRSVLYTNLLQKCRQ